MPEITVHQNGKTKTFFVQENTILHMALQQHGFSVESPCNGKGICGKCRVQIHGRQLPYTDEELKHLQKDEMEAGIHLSCMIKIYDNLEITVQPGIENASIMTDAKVINISGTPIINKRYIELSAPTLDDQTADAERVFSELNQKESTMILAEEKPVSFCKTFPLDILQRLPDTIRENEFKITVVELMGQPVGVESGKSANTLYGVSVDIGTTTLAAYLYDLNSAQQIAVASMLNPQKKYGADVISRIGFSSENHTNRNIMAKLIRDALNELINRLALVSGLKPSDIYLAVLAGNTIMIHLLLELPAMNIAAAPFVPVTSSGLLLKTEELNLKINPSGRIIILPSVSAYVGADTVAAVLSSGMYKDSEITLLVDIGTNGEIVLGNNELMYACSTAAGPAFEGANITCGTGGVEGAINKVYASKDGELRINTIGGKPAIGICGSGLIDAIACMVQVGIVDETGRIIDRDELPVKAVKYADRLIEINDQPAFLLASPAENPGNRKVFITQKDIREVQNAKAAIAAGINVLISEAGYTVRDIKNVYLAGGFGSYIDISSAITIGLLPKELDGRINAIGNAAGAGTIQSMIALECLHDTDLIARKIKYLELSSRQDFVLEYTNNMFFIRE